MSGMSVSLSGVLSAQRVMNSIQKNIANASTEGYKKNIDELMDVQTGGVDVKSHTASNPFLENLMQNAIRERMKSDILQSGIEELDKLPYDSLEESYNNMISAMHNVQGFPSNSSVKAFNASSKNFAESVTEFSDRIANIKSQTTDNISLNQREVDSLQAALEAMNDRGVADEDEVNSIKSQLMQATDNIAAYQKILDKIIPPIETLFKTGVEQTMGDINFAMAQDVLNSYPFDLEQNTFSGIFSSDITTLAKTRTPTFDDDKFTGIIGSMKTDVGVLMVNADAKVKSSTSYMDTIKKSYDKTFGVDMVEESVKMMQMQQLYQANAMAIKVQDNLFQTTINLIA